MKSKNILTLLVCTGLALSAAAPIAHAEDTAATKIEAAKAKRLEAVQKHATEKKAKIDEQAAKKTERIEKHAANKEATVQAHKDANAAKKEILQKNRDAIKASKTATTNP